jgi:hypothetical protein
MSKSQSPVVNDIDFKVRGAYLVACSEIDTLLTEIIARYFCDNRRKRENLIDLLVNQRLQLGPKIQLLNEILKRDYPEYMRQHGAGLIERLRKINELRTKLAHYRRVGQTKSSDTTLRLEYFKDGVLTAEDISAVKIKVWTTQAFDVRLSLWRTLYLISKGKSKLLPRTKGGRGKAVIFS